MPNRVELDNSVRLELRDRQKKIKTIRTLMNQIAQLGNLNQLEQQQHNHLKQLIDKHNLDCDPRELHIDTDKGYMEVHLNEE